MWKCQISNYQFTLISFATVLVSLAVNVNVLAQPYERSTISTNTISFHSVAFAKHKIHYASSGDLDKPGVLFIHGTPGGWEAFESYLQSTRLQRDFFIVSVDRLGWGQSALAPELIDGEFGLQARAIKAVIDQYPMKKWTLVGHSLGASIAPKVALYAPDSVDSLLLLAGSLDPKLGKPRWYNWAASTWAVSSLIGNSMRYSNREIMGLAKQLKLMDAELKLALLDADLLIMQGAKDKLVSPKNPSYAASQWEATFNTVDVIQLSDEGHFLPWRQAALVVQSLYKLRAAREPGNATKR